MCNCKKCQENLGDFITDATNAVKNFGTNAANEVVDASIGPVKEACRQGTVIAIKEYSIPVTAGIAAILTVFTYAGFKLGQHYKSKK